MEARLAILKGLSADDHTFLWKMLHNLLPTQERLHRMKFKTAPTPDCTQCDRAEPDQLHHALVTCPQNNEVADWLMQSLHHHIPALSPEQLVVLHLGDLENSLELPLVWLIVQVLSSIWKSRLEKKKPQLRRTRAELEAGIAIMRKTRFQNSCTLLETIISS